jgi:hypothetical protein
MYLVIIAWIYVVLMMSVAEATNTNGTVLGAIVTFFLYGVGPAGLVAYLMGTPARNRANKKRMAEELAAYQAANPSAEPDAGSHAASGAQASTPAIAATDGASVAPMRKEP